MVMTDASLYLSHEIASTSVLGPGLRYGIWMQGCKKNCPGCVFPQGRSLNSGGYHKSIDALLADICHAPAITGVTISGGEPFLQAEALARLLVAIRENTFLDVMLYSGYTLDELREWRNPAVEMALACADLLIDGEYVEEENDNALYRGSANQQIWFLSDKYLPYKEKIMNAKNRSIQFVNTEAGLFMIGIPARGFKRKFFNTLIKKAQG